MRETTQQRSRRDRDVKRHVLDHVQRCSGAAIKECDSHTDTHTHQCHSRARLQRLRSVQRRELARVQRQRRHLSLPQRRCLIAQRDVSAAHSARRGCMLWHGVPAPTSANLMRLTFCCLARDCESVSGTRLGPRAAIVAVSAADTPVGPDWAPMVRRCAPHAWRDV